MIDFRKLVFSGIKRFFDIIGGAVGCIIMLPLMILVKILKLSSGDHTSLFYTQTRIGKSGKPFKLYKFRSMVPHADEALKELLKDDDRRKEWDLNQKFDNDPRITKAGRFLRRTSLDEFPQFVNVLKGDMSLVGPRPLAEGELESHHGSTLYYCVKPGITGWWACNGRSNIEYQERLELEYYYVNNYSLCLDVLCILKTIPSIITNEGAK